MPHHAGPNAWILEQNGSVKINDKTHPYIKKKEYKIRPFFVTGGLNCKQ